MEKAAVKKCENYQVNRVYKSLKEVIDHLGGMDKFVKKGDEVLLKVNLIQGKAPEKAVTTHPQLVEALSSLVKKAGGKVIIGDSPGGRFTENSLSKIYQVSGLTELAEKPGIKLNFNTDSHRVNFNKGKLKNSFEICDYIMEADKIINLPKLKTHGLTMYTGAVKNMFGAIPGLLKGEYHLKMPEVEVFSEMLLDLALMINPCLNIMDAVIGMEGDGPAGGTPRKFGYILASSSPVSLDWAGMYLMGITSKKQVPLINSFKKRGLDSKIELKQVVGDELIPAAEVRIPLIEKRSNLIDQKLPAFLGKAADYLLKPRPVFNAEKCVKCGKCIENCPRQVIKMGEKKPEVNLKDCIRCFCCQELCGYDAVEIKRPILGKILFSR